MFLRSRGGWAAAVVTIALALATSTKASADRRLCVQSHDRGVNALTDHRLKEARESFVACAADACPAVVRGECSKSLAEVEGHIPSLVFAASDSRGGDVVDVRVVLDGTVVAERIDGRAVEVDPGPHVVRFERKGGAPVELSVVAKEGEKNRAVTATLPATLVSVVAPQSTSTAPALSTGPASTPSDRQASTIPILPLAIAGVGAAAIGTGIFVRLSADAEAERLQRTCAPECEASQRDDLSTRVVVSNMAVGAGIGVLVVAGLVWFLQTRGGHH